MIKALRSDCEFGKFPCGESRVSFSTGELPPESRVNVVFNYERDEEIIQLCLLVDAIKRANYRLGDLVMPYVPYGRQDRAANAGESFSLKVFANLINSLGFNKVLVDDPHSEVTTALIENICVLEQHDIFAPYFDNKKNFWLISPDGGALKKIYKLAAQVNSKGVVECSKLRDTKTGAITGTRVHAIELGGDDCYIVDDICDGGRTFVEIAKELRKKTHGKIILMASHGFFTRGISVFDGLIDEIYTRKGKLK